MTAAPRITIAFNTSAKPAGPPAFAAPAANAQSHIITAEDREKFAKASDRLENAITEQNQSDRSVDEAENSNDDNDVVITNTNAGGKNTKGNFVQNAKTQKKARFQKKKYQELNWRLYLQNQMLRDMTRAIPSK